MCMTIAAIPIATVVEHYATKLLFQVVFERYKKKNTNSWMSDAAHIAVASILLITIA